MLNSYVLIVDKVFTVEVFHRLWSSLEDAVKVMDLDMQFIHFR